ncbi:OmpP1/FadL family transporter [Maridesulfovibrio ferrireducens]|uniref:OmpP1/FadL family transporter n=1 Tax=Maridesulfovibrio ferrireducens TaxID=246191 RepID=UPI001A318268|nr:OmpP1/FadL family transporter [Maridesulfovibrio ferrireducens]MBI9111341.1 transporter [Maridesulfovibrio ferrireducens]
MKNKFTVCVSVLLIMIGLMLSSSICTKAEAAGFALYEWSARGNALGGAMVAKADDPSALAWNPAGITQLLGTQVLAGISTIAPSNDVTTSYNGNSKKESINKKVFVPPHAYFTHQVNDSLWFGVGSFSRYGLGTSFDEDWSGRYSSYDTEINSFSVNPNMAYKINKYISIAAGFELMYVRADLRKKFDPTGTKNTATDVDQRIIVDNITPGFNAGIRVTPNDQWAIGFSYRSKMIHHATGSASYNVPTGISTATRFNDNDITMSMNTPNTFSFGLEYKPLTNLSFEADAIYSEWSAYSDISYDFAKTNSIGIKNYIAEKKWEDVWRFQFGVEYLPIEDLALRVGYVYDQSPIREGYEDYMLPSNDRQIVSTGLGYKFDNFVVDVSYMYLWMKDRTIAARPGTGVLDTKTANGLTHIVGLSLGYNF